MNETTIKPSIYKQFSWMVPLVLPTYIIVIFIFTIIYDEKYSYSRLIMDAINFCILVFVMIFVNRNTVVKLTDDSIRIQKQRGFTPIWISLSDIASVKESKFTRTLTIETKDGYRGLVNMSIYKESDLTKIKCFLSNKHNKSSHSPH